MFINEVEMTVSQIREIRYICSKTGDGYMQ